MKPMTIGRLSKAGGVKVTTIRYYESIGLMGEPDRSESGQRLYGEESVQRLSFIRHARDLGFPMDASFNLNLEKSAQRAIESRSVSLLTCASA